MKAALVVKIGLFVSEVAGKVQGVLGHSLVGFGFGFGFWHVGFFGFRCFFERQQYL